MGSFSMTCCLSGLPIEAGDPVRYFMLTQSPYSDSRVHDVNGLWFPRTLPLKAKYNDYGSVEEVENPLGQKTWMQGLQLDLVERGWGENQCHDVPTPKTMSFKKLLEALWEERVQITREAGVFHVGATGDLEFRESGDTTKFEVPDGVPTVARVTELLIEEGFGIQDDDLGRKVNFLVDDDDGYGCIRVRTGGYGSDRCDQLYILAKLLDPHYATMVTKGKGAYSFDAEMLVRPLPKVKEFIARRKDGMATMQDKPLKVQQAMIREDVWQAMIKVSYADPWDLTDKASTVADCYRGARRAWKIAVAVGADYFLPSSLMGFTPKQDDDGPPDHIQHQLCKDAIPFTLGLSTNFLQYARQHKKLTGKKLDAFLDTVAEFLFIQSIMSLSRQVWRPVYSTGPQSGFWNLHAQVADVTAKIAHAIDRETAADRDEILQPRRPKPKARVKPKTKVTTKAKKKKKRV